MALTRWNSLGLLAKVVTVSRPSPTCYATAVRLQRYAERASLNNIQCLHQVAPPPKKNSCLRNCEPCDLQVPNFLVSHDKFLSVNFTMDNHILLACQGNAALTNVNNIPLLFTSTINHVWQHAGRIGFCFNSIATVGHANVLPYSISILAAVVQATIVKLTPLLSFISMLSLQIFEVSSAHRTLHHPWACFPSLASLGIHVF